MPCNIGPSKNMDWPSRWGIGKLHDNSHMMCIKAMYRSTLDITTLSCT